MYKKIASQQNIPNSWFPIYILCLSHISQYVGLGLKVIVLKRFEIIKRINSFLPICHHFFVFCLSSFTSSIVFFLPEGCPLPFVVLMGFAGGNSFSFLVI